MSQLPNNWNTLPFMRSIVVKVSNAGVAFNREVVVGWAATNLPAGAFSFSERETYYWELEMQSFEANTLFVAATDLEADAIRFDFERPARSTIKKVDFRPLPRNTFLSQLAYYQLTQLNPFLTGERAMDDQLEPQIIAPDFSEFGIPPQEDPADIDSRVGRLVDRPITFRVKLLSLTIKNGHVAGEIDLPEAVDPIPFTIGNDHLVAEFNAIKPFFVTRLKRRTVEVRARLTNRETGQWKVTGATSPQIDRIDDGMIELFRTRTLRELLNGRGVRTIDKSLFSPEDLFESLEDEELGRATLPNDAFDLLGAILASQKIRNGKQLTFLAGELRGVGEKLRYVLSPKFGFVFLVEGREANHYILELLNDHATYVWSIPEGWGTREEETDAIERELSKIGALGRQQYRRLLSFEHHFWMVVHESVEGGVVDGFARWRVRLLEGLG